LKNKLWNRIWSLCVIFIVFSIFVGTAAATSSVKLTSVTLDPTSPTGQTEWTRAWSTNLADSLSQLGVKDSSGFLNGHSGAVTLGEVSIPLNNGTNTFDLIGSNLPQQPAGSYYSAELFLDGVAVHPQISVYNSDGGSGSFVVNANGVSIMGSANGGIMPDIAPGSSIYVAPDGANVEVISYDVSTQGTTDEVGFNTIGADGYTDTIAHLTLEVTPPRSPSVPEFPSIVVPVAAILGLVMIIGRRKNTD
jgi:hypothetical protein